MSSHISTDCLQSIVLSSRVTGHVRMKKIDRYNLSIPKPGQTSGRSGRGSARRGGEGARGWVGRNAVGSIRPGDNPPLCPPANR